MSATMVVRSVSPQITTLSVPFLRFNRFKFGGRATIVRLQTGTLAVFSPVSLTQEARDTVTSLGGNVSYIIAPDIEHHMQLGPWKAAYQNAQVIGPEGLREKRAKQGNEDVVIDHIFTKENKRSIKLPEDFAREFEVEYFDGHANKELAFLHKPTRTFINADLVFNLPAYEQYSKTGENPGSGVYGKLMTMILGIHGKGQQRFIWWAAARDKSSFSQSAKVVAGWDFDKIIPCHGDVIETEGSAIFKRLFAWHL